MSARDKPPTNAEKVRRVVDSGDLRQLLEKRYDEGMVDYIISAVYRQAAKRKKKVHA